MRLADVIDQHEGAILEIWYAQTKSKPAARGLTRAQVLDSMPEVIRALAGALDDARAKPERWGTDALLENHLSLRLREGFNLDDVVYEYTFLGEALSRVCSSLDSAERPRPGELERFFLTLNAIVSAAVATFSRHMAADEQIQKRYLRLLDQLAADALVDGATPLDERFGALADLVRDAVDAHSARIEVHGDDAEARERSPAPRVVASTMAYPLVSRGREIGVLSVRLDAPRGFEPWQRRRLGALAERLALLIDNAALYHARQQSIDGLERERDLRERFVAVLAHDLRGPLSAAKLAASMLSARPERLEDRRGFALRIERNIERADRMIRDLLDVNRVRAGEGLPLRIEECELGSILQDVATELELEHGPRFDVRADYPLRGRWSAEELQRSIWNLATNAVKYGSAETRIDVTARRRGDVVLVSVHNVGPVIPPDEIPGLFDAFSRSSAAKRGERQGWGLGLTLVRGAAEAHGGSVAVSSSEESGTTFTIRLPLDARPYQPGGEIRTAIS